MTESKLNAISHVVAEWQMETFPAATVQSVVSHLQEEAAELQSALKEDGLVDGKLSPRGQAEAADVQILLMAVGRLGGFELGEAVGKKLAVLQTRQWASPDSDGVVRHVKSEKMRGLPRIRKLAEAIVRMADKNHESLGSLSHDFWALGASILNACDEMEGV